MVFAHLIVYVVVINALWPSETRDQVPKGRDKRVQFLFDEVPQGQKSDLISRDSQNYIPNRKGEIYRFGILLPTFVSGW